MLACCLNICTLGHVVQMSDNGMGGVVTGRSEVPERKLGNLVHCHKIPRTKLTRC